MFWRNRDKASADPERTREKTQLAKVNRRLDKLENRTRLLENQVKVIRREA